MPTHLLRAAGALLLVFALSKPAAAQQAVSLEDGAVTFTLPQGFQAMSAELLATKYPAGANAPQHAYATASTRVSLAVTFSPANVTMEQLPQLMQEFERLLPRLNPSIRWVTRELVEINGRRFVHLEFTSEAIDTPIHNHTFITSFRGKMLGFNYNATDEEYDAHRDALLRSSGSIQVEDR